MQTNYGRHTECAQTLHHARRKELVIAKFSGQKQSIARRAQFGEKSRNTLEKFDSSFQRPQFRMRHRGKLKDERSGLAPQSESCWAKEFIDCGMCIEKKRIGARGTTAVVSFVGICHFPRRLHDKAKVLGHLRSIVGKMRGRQCTVKIAVQSYRAQQRIFRISGQPILGQSRQAASTTPDDSAPSRKIPGGGAEPHRSRQTRSKIAQRAVRRLRCNGRLCRRTIIKKRIERLNIRHGQPLPLFLCICEHAPDCCALHPLTYGKSTWRAFDTTA